MKTHQSEKYNIETCENGVELTIQMR